jgi:hypothetical protein
VAKTKKNPQDATLRNVRASRAREATLGSRISALEYRVALLEAWIVSDIGTRYSLKLNRKR